MLKYIYLCHINFSSLFRALFFCSKRWTRNAFLLYLVMPEVNYKQKYEDLLAEKSRMEDEFGQKRGQFRQLYLECEGMFWCFFIKFVELNPLFHHVLKHVETGPLICTANHKNILHENFRCFNESILNILRFLIYRWMNRNVNLFFLDLCLSSSYVYSQFTEIKF